MNFVTCDTALVGSCILLIFWRERKREACSMYVLAQWWNSTEGGCAEELGVFMLTNQLQ